MDGGLLTQDGDLLAQEKLFQLNPWISLEQGPSSDEHLLINAQSGVICSCNPTAWSLLSQLKDGATLAHLSDSLTQAHAVSQDIARRDSLTFLHKLTAMGCIDEQG